MCNCIKEVEQKMKEINYPDAESVSFDNIELFSGRIYSTISIKRPGKKKLERVNIIHSFCPICGEKYPEKKEKKS
jgi:hypothetical protein